MTKAAELLELPSARMFGVIEFDAAVTVQAAWGWKEAGLTVRSVRGSKMRTTRALMDEVSAALQFPYYFGENWAAFDECLSDMDWLLPAAGIVILIGDAPEVLADAPDELANFVQTVMSAASEYSKPVAQGECWDRPALPFNVVLQVAPELSDELNGRWAAVGAMLVSLAV